MQTVKERIEQRTLDEANYIIANKTTVRATAQAYDKVSKSTVHKDVTLQNGKEIEQVIPESIEIKKVFLAEKNPVVRLGMIIK